MFEGKEKVITDKIEILPQGRGRVVVIAHKHTPKKPKEHKRKNPRLTLFRIKSNPEDLSLRTFLDSEGIPRHVIFPEARQLSIEERERIAIGCLVTLLPLTRGKREMDKLAKNVSKMHYHISQDFRHLLDLEYRRYQKWRIKNS